MLWWSYCNCVISIVIVVLLYLGNRYWNSVIVVQLYLSKSYWNCVIGLLRLPTSFFLIKKQILLVKYWVWTQYFHHLFWHAITSYCFKLEMSFNYRIVHLIKDMIGFISDLSYIILLFRYLRVYVTEINSGFNGETCQASNPHWNWRGGFRLHRRLLIYIL